MKVPFFQSTELFATLFNDRPNYPNQEQFRALNKGKSLKPKTNGTIKNN